MFMLIGKKGAGSKFSWHFTEVCGLKASLFTVDLKVGNYVNPNAYFKIFKFS